jgi:plastocyanin
MGMHVWAVRLAGITLLLAAGLVFVACGDDDDGGTPAPTAAATQPSGPATATVKVADNSFTPSVTVRAGGKVTWDWSGSQNPHSVVGTSANAKDLIKSEVFRGGSGKYEVTFAAPGTYDYQCGIHGAAMSGKVVVQ